VSTINFIVFGILWVSKDRVKVKSTSSVIFMEKGYIYTKNKNVYQVCFRESDITQTDDEIIKSDTDENIRKSENIKKIGSDDDIRKPTKIRKR
jgi:hypothetical protein